jgi:hypothetical protein
MEARDAFSWVKQDLARLLANGHEFVHTRSLLEAITQQEASAPHISQFFSLENQTRIANADRKNASDLEMFKSVLDTGKTALTTSILVNGGAAVSLLAFIANVVGKANEAINVAAVAGALMWFVAGVLLAALATGTTYLSQSLYAANVLRTNESSSTFFRWATFVLVATAYVFFVFGALCAYKALT